MIQDLNQTLEEMAQNPYYSWGRTIILMKKYFEEWATNELSKGIFDDFKLAYMPFLMNVSPEGSTNNEIAKQAKVTKQAMSKVVKELTRLGLIYVEPHPTDKRAVMIYLTDKGKRMIIKTKQQVYKLTCLHKQIVGEERFLVALEAMKEIIAYHQSGQPLPEYKAEE